MYIVYKLYNLIYMKYICIMLIFNKKFTFYK